MKRNFLIVIAADQPQRAASLPNLDSQLMKLYSVTSVFSDKRIADDTNVERVDRETPSSTFSKGELNQEETSPRELISLNLSFSN